MEIDGRRLQRHWLGTPLTMTLVLAVIFHVVAWWSIIGNAPYYAPVPLDEAIRRAGWTPLAIAGFFGLVGLLWGSRHSSRARAVMDDAFGVETLDDNHWITRRVHSYAEKLDLPPPSVGVMAAANAYAVGASINDAAVVIGQPLIETLDGEELDAVIGHELGHIVTGDMRRMQMAEGYQTMFVAFAQSIIVFTVNRVVRSRLGRWLGYLVARLARHSLFLGTELMVMRLSRRREYFADAVGALLTSREAMIGALRKLHDAPAQQAAEAQYGYLMLRGGSFGHLFATHPSLQQRVAALEAGGYVTAVLARAGRVSGEKDSAEPAPANIEPKEEMAGSPAALRQHQPMLAGADTAFAPAAEAVMASSAAREWELLQVGARVLTKPLLGLASLLLDVLMAVWPLSLFAAAALGFFATLAWLS